MKTPRPRFTLRTLMVVVLAMSVACWIGLMARRSANYKATSTRHALEAASLETALGYLHPAVFDPDRLVIRRVEYHTRLRDKYLRASRRPWLSLDEDESMPN